MPNASALRRRPHVILVYLCGVLLFAVASIGAALAARKTPARQRPGISLDVVKERLNQIEPSSKAADQLQQVYRNPEVWVRDVVLNARLVKRHDPDYTVTLPCGPPTNQAHSGRCWIFAATNGIRTQLLAQERVDHTFQLSNAYLHFFNMLEKSNTYLEHVIQTRGRKMHEQTFRQLLQPSLSDGGWFTDFSFLTKKYGLVPETAMPETQHSLDTSTLTNILNSHLAAGAVEMSQKARSLKKKSATEQREQLRAIRDRYIDGVLRILVTHLGQPPVDSFEFRVPVVPIAPSGEGEATTARVKAQEALPGMTRADAEVKTFTPQEFLSDVVGFNPNDYVTVSTNPLKRTRRCYLVPQSSIGRSAAGCRAKNLRLLNLSPFRLMQLTKKSIDRGQPVWFGADVTKDVDPETGIMHPDIFSTAAVLDLPPQERPKDLSLKQLRYICAMEPNHAMAFVGYDMPKGTKRPQKLLVENSWGPGVGDNGMLHMYAEWFDRNVFEVVVHKDLLSPKERAIWRAKSVKLKKSDWYY